MAMASRNGQPTKGKGSFGKGWLGDLMYGMWMAKGKSKGRSQQFRWDPSKTVWIGGVAEATTWKSLQQLADRAGKSKWVEIFHGKGKGTAAVVYGTAEEASKAVSILNGMALEGESIVVDFWVANRPATSCPEKSSQTLRLTVTTLIGEVIELQSEVSATVSDLMRIISSKINLPSAKLRLVHDGLPLASAASLEECGIKDRASLSLIIRNSEKILVTGCMDGYARCFKIDSGNCVYAVETTDWNEETEADLPCYALQPSVAMSPDGLSFLTGCATGAVKLWCTETGTCTKVLSSPSLAPPGPDPPRKFVLFCPDCVTALVGCEKGGLQLFDLQSEKNARILTTYGVSVFALSSDGLTVAVVPTEKCGAELLDITSGACLRTVQGHTAGIVSVAFAPNGLSFVTGSPDASARVWSVGTGECIQTLCREPYATGSFGDFGPHCEDVQAVAYSPDSSLIVTGCGMERECQVWRVDSGECVLTLTGERGVLAAAFAADGLTFVTGTYKSAKVWCTESGELTQQFEHPDEVGAVAPYITG